MGTGVGRLGRFVLLLLLLLLFLSRILCPLNRGNFSHLHHLPDPRMEPVHGRRRRWARMRR
jgi:hypothetical protein